MEKNETIGRAPIPEPLVDQMVAFANFLFVDGACLELRVIGDKNSADWKNKQSLSGFYNDPKKMIEDAKVYHAKKSIYVGLNPRRPELLHVQPANSLHAGEGGKNEDVLFRRWFPIDIDTKRPHKRIAATDVEISHALPVYESVRNNLNSKGIESIGGLSGNGRHLSQIRVLKTYCEQNNIKDSEFYTDEGISGTKTKNYIHMRP